MEEVQTITLEGPSENPNGSYKPAMKNTTDSDLIPGPENLTFSEKC